jgi:predicted amidohydrolase
VNEGQRGERMKIAGVQCDVVFKDKQANLRRMEEFAEQAAAAGAGLTVFPECVLAGYCFESLEEARPFAESIPGPASEAMAAVCKRLGMHLVFGMLELDGPAIYNAAVLVGPQGLVASYRKVHLPYLGIDMFTSYGDRPFAVHDAGEVRVGMNICYDASFPEAARSLMLLGADLIALPTNWPPGSECVAQATIRCRALENSVYFLAVNRVGTENGFPFIGQSQLVDPRGNVIHHSHHDREEIFYGDVDVHLARRKHLRRVPGKHEVDRRADRRPSMYGLLVEPHALKSPGRD